MSKFVLDTNALGDLAARRRGVTERAAAARRAGHSVGTIAPALAEFLGGLEASVTADRNRPAAERMIRELKFWPDTVEAAREYGRLYAAMRRRGQTIQFVDLIVAAVALTLRGGIVVSSDSDLRRVPGLHVEDWSDPPPPANGSA